MLNSNSYYLFITQQFFEELHDSSTIIKKVRFTINLGNDVSLQIFTMIE